MNTIRKSVPAFIVAAALLCSAPGARGEHEGVSIFDLKFGTNPSNSPVADILSGQPGNSINEISLGIALENLCGQVVARGPILDADTFNLFQLCFATLVPAVSALLEDSGFIDAQTAAEVDEAIEQLAGFLFDTGGREVTSLASSFTQLTPTGLTVTQQRLAQLRLAQAESPGAEALAYDARTGALSFGLDSGGAAGDVFGNRWRFYVNGDASTGDKDETELEIGYDFDGFSLDAGADYRLRDDRFIGFNLAANRVDLDYASGSRADVTTYDATAYGLWFGEDGWYLQGLAGLGTGDIDLSRQLRFRTRSNTLTLPDGSVIVDIFSPFETIDANFDSESDADRLFASLTAGRDFQRGPVTIGVSSALDFLEVDFDGYTETADDVRATVLELEIDDYEYQSLRLITGVDLSRAVSTKHGVWVPFLRGEWIHEFEDDPTSIQARFAADPFSTGFVQRNGSYGPGVPAVNPTTGLPDPTTFRVTADDPDQDYFQFSAGTSAVLPDGLQLFVSLSTIVGLSDFNRYTLRAGLSKEW